MWSLRIRRAVAATTAAATTTVATAHIDLFELVEVVLVRRNEVRALNAEEVVHAGLLVPAPLVAKTEPVPDLLTGHMLPSVGIVIDRVRVLQEELLHGELRSSRAFL